MKLLTTTAAIAHKILKEKHADGTLQLRNTCLPSSEALNRLIGEIHTAYTERSGKSYGTFEADEINYPTALNLRKHYHEKAVNFVDTSIALMNTLLVKANEASSNLATGGSVLIADITNGEAQWLVVTILTDKMSAAIDDNLNLVESIHLDLNGMRFAGRVNITKWLNGDDRYISFLKGGSNDVSNYFQSFLGCIHPKAWQQETMHLVKSIRKAVSTLSATDDQREAARQAAFQYLDKCAKESAPVSIDILCNHIWPNDPNALRTHLNDPETGISDGFTPQRRALKGLVRFEGKGKKWQIKFEREAVINGEIILNDNDKVLTIKNVPDDFVDRFKEDFSIS
ncbi:nucleoid-associated protein [Nitrosomonas aestuarii]|uniref:Nucleoid-associated protein n=2 Tax=Nitrosomonas aestuarii TaxID=52441 RepID=A0A1I4DHP2_9PROT|nr:nucleoid-associated protein [Nitrosomonas aestuarii]